MNGYAIIMEADRCKANACCEPSINSNFCGKHTRKWQPVYLKYKYLEEKLPDVVPEDIRSLRKLYNHYAKIYRLRQDFRSALKPNFHDKGHEHAIDYIKTSMDDIEQKMLKLSVLEKPSDPASDSDSDSDFEESYVESHKAPGVEDNDDWDKRIGCLGIIIEEERIYRENLYEILVTILRNRSDDVIRRLYGGQLSGDALNTQVLRLKSKISTVALLVLDIVELMQNVSDPSLAYTMRWQSRHTTTSYTAKDYKTAIHSLAISTSLSQLAYMSVDYIECCSSFRQNHRLKYYAFVRGDDIVVRADDINLTTFSNQDCLGLDISVVKFCFSAIGDVEIPAVIIKKPSRQYKISCRSCIDELESNQPYKSQGNHVADHDRAQVHATLRDVYSDRLWQELPCLRVTNV